MRETLEFCRNFISDPRRVSAILPSGTALGALMTREITANHAPVIELGPGTGVFTRSLVASGVPERQLILVEAGAEFAAGLERRFPEATVLHADAARLGELSLPDGQKAGAVVSGIPLLAMPESAIEQTLAGAFGHLREDGAFYQCTYGVRCPVPSAVRERLGLQATHMGWAFANLPPAAVYRISRAAAPAAG